jgi:hypothetical protein
MGDDSGCLPIGGLEQIKIGGAPPANEGDFQHGFHSP